MQCRPVSYLRALISTAVVLGFTFGAPGRSAAQASPGGGSTTSAAGQRADIGMPNDVIAASAFLLAVYPDLNDQPLSLAAKRVDGQVIVSVRPGTPASDPGPDGVRAPALLGAVFAFTAAGDLQSFVAQGVLVDGARNAVFGQTVAEHPAWTTAEAEVSLLAMGGRPAGTSAPFTPIDPARVAAFIGTQGQSDAPQLQLVGSRTAVGRPTASPGWVARVQAVGHDGQLGTYLFQYEPFTGRLVAAVRQ